MQPHVVFIIQSITFTHSCFLIHYARDLVASGASVDPTSQVRSSTMLVLPIVGNYEA
jgi:hypothetical protein